MYLNELLDGTNLKCDKNVYINKVKTNSKEVNKNDMFIAIKGFTHDGHNFIKEAINNGASVIIVNDDYKIDDNEVIILKTIDTRIIVSKIISNYYHNPSREFVLIGITGTKGKTTTSFMIKRILEESSNKVGYIGTLGSYINEKLIYENDRTTPDSITLQRLFRIMADNNCKYVILEVSSISLKQHRVDNCSFDIGIFTNFSKDHISVNEHPSLDDYFDSKTKLFEMCEVAFINNDDEQVRKVLNKRCIFKTYSIKYKSDKKAFDLIYLDNTISYKTNIYNKEEIITLRLPGSYEIYNSLAAISICEYLNINKDYIIKGLKEVVVKGRYEIINNNIIIDYAHNPSSLENLLTTVNENKKGKIICVFGCGGNRDKTKRPIMGKISGLLSDYTIITSDNPRYEDRLDIINDIEEGIKLVTNNYKKIIDRTEAIKYALQICKKNDIIVLTGKGHETYEEVNGIKYHYDEREIIKKIIDERSMKNERI